MRGSFELRSFSQQEDPAQKDDTTLQRPGSCILVIKWLFHLWPTNTLSSIHLKQYNLELPYDIFVEKLVSDNLLVWKCITYVECYLFCFSVCLYCINYIVFISCFKCVCYNICEQRFIQKLWQNQPQIHFIGKLRILVYTQSFSQIICLITWFRVIE